MREITFTNPKTNVVYKRISKRKARKLFIEDKKSIIMMPCNMRLFTNWGGWSIINGQDLENPEYEFERIVNLCTYYNCNNETGKYPSFYATDNN